MLKNESRNVENMTWKHDFLNQDSGLRKHFWNIYYITYFFLFIYKVQCFLQKRRGHLSTGGGGLATGGGVLYGV